VESVAKLYGNIGKASVDEGDWTTFVDPEVDAGFYDHMSDKVLVKFMGENWERGPWIVVNQFPPNCRANTHAHNHDTVYVITKGSMTFNDGSGWYGPGEVRWVRADTWYGPEEAGADGCEFVLISQGPIHVQWEGGETYEANA
jgi:hypothetical protein